MLKQQLTSYILQTYDIQPDFPFSTYPSAMVFRHPDNKKWFALCMDVSRKKLGLSGDGSVDILNVKCDPLMIGSLLKESGILPAYHMNKANWITVLLDNSASDEHIKMLLDISYTMTLKKIPQKQKRDF